MRSSSATYQSLAEPRPLGAKDVQRDLLDPQTLLLDYAVGSERSFVWAITRDTIRAYELPPRAQLEKAVRHFRGAIAARAEHRANETPAEWHARAAKGDLRAAAAVRTLSNLVLAPVWRDHTARRIVVVPHGVLQLIPFGLLPVPSESSTRGGHSTPLILRQEVVHLPSVSALAWLRSGKTRSAGASKVIAIFADPIFERADERVVVNRPLATETPVQASIIDRPPLFPSASRLFATRWEAGQIAALVPKDQTWVLMDSTASRSTALDARLGRYRVVHFATHAFVDDRRPSLGGILLSRVDAGGRAVPGFLSLQDVFTLRLRTELVVLGGCRTGLGTMVEGEGFLSLSRGFFHAGVPRVIAGLWAVDDVATAQLMVYFYRAMFGPSRLSPAAALRAAQLEMQKNPRWQSPYYWAGFVLQGEWT